jgi:polyhydroxyalkanoate synthesis regulator phasin
MNKKNKKILAINKPISELTEKEVDEVIKELVKNGSLILENQIFDYKIYHKDK